jgi:hypothetical protein
MSNLSDDQDNGAEDESQEEGDETSSSESNGGFSTGTSASEGEDDDGGVSASSSHSDDAIRSGHPPMPDPPTDDDRLKEASTDYSVVRGEFNDDEDDQEAETSKDPLLGSVDEGAPYTDSNAAQVDEHALDSLSAGEPHRSIDLTFSTPPRAGQHDRLSEPGVDDVEEEHEIVFEASEQPDEPELFPSALLDTDNPSNADDKQQITEDSDKVTKSENTNTASRDRRSRFPSGISRIFARKQQRTGSSKSVAPPAGASETDALVVPSGSPPEVPQHQTQRRWLPFSGRQTTKRPSLPAQADIASPILGDSEENVPQNEAGTSPVDTVTSPARTEPISDASDSPAPPRLSGRGYFERRRRETVPLSPNDIIAEPSTARVLFSGASPKKSHQHVEDASPEGDSANELDDTSTLGIAVSVRTLFIAGVALTLVVILSTIGTSFLGAELALRGNTFGTNLESSRPDRPNGGSNTTNQNNTDVPHSIRRDICEGDQLLLEFEIKFDSQPAEVGIALRDSGPFGGASLWAFDAFSFRSFTQFLRTNVFSICLPPEPTYEFEVTDAFGNGLVSTFGTSTLVYGQWTLYYNSSIIASYEGNCNATRGGNADTGSAAKFSQCGSYCKCSYRFSSIESTGNCSTNCTRR